VKTFQLDQFLAPYDLASYNRWRQLSCHISADVLAALQPVRGDLCSVLLGMHQSAVEGGMQLAWACIPQAPGPDFLGWGGCTVTSRLQHSSLAFCMQAGGNINILAEADPSLLRPATAAEQALEAARQALLQSQ